MELLCFQQVFGNLSLNYTKSMRWTPSNIVSGMQSLMSKSSGKDAHISMEAMADIRRAMLDELTLCDYQISPLVQSRVSDADDIQDLWYLRGDLMAVIAATDGELAAKRKIAHISTMFKGLLPRGLSSRPSPLGE
jgi:hypothetical protein